MEVKIPREIKSFTESVIGSFTLRQATCIGISLALAIATYTLIPNLQQIIKILLGVVLILPVMLFGFYEYNGMKAEQFIKLMVQHLFSNKKLKCRPKSFYEFIILERGKNARFTQINETDK
ncbi:MAG: PrgI family protein [Saccharofermentanales bacterium]|jgi:hypothetical protein